MTNEPQNHQNENLSLIQKSKRISDLLTEQKVKQGIAGRLPAGMDPDKFIFGIMTAVQKNPDLLLCDPNSVLLAAYDAAELGINLSPTLALGWLIPYKAVCNFQVSYRGLMQKAHETKAVKSFFAEVVYDGDQFQRQFAPKRNLFHAPGPDESKRIRENAIGAYALIEYIDGTQDWEFLTTEQIERRRRHSKAPDSLMWKTFWEEGYRKTPVRVLWKRIPLMNSRMEQLAEAVERDTEREIDVEPTGKIELEPDNAVPGAIPLGTGLPLHPQPATIPPAPEMVHVLFCVGETETVLTGDVRTLLEDLPKIGARLDRKNHAWKLPADRTAELVELLELKHLIFREVDEDGKFMDTPDSGDFNGNTEVQTAIWPKR